MSEPKFKVGQKVRCKKHCGCQGLGHRIGRVFIIDHYQETTMGTTIYWEKNNGGGVYEDSLELNKITNWKGEF